MKTIKIECHAATTLPLHQLKIIQGHLKTLSKEDYESLRAQILELGFSFAPHVWKNNHGEYCILDGTQRILVLRSLVVDGYQCPEIPVVFIEAKCYEDAIKKLLGGASHYGKADPDGLYELTHKANLALSDLARIKLPGIETKKFIKGYFLDEEEEIKPKTKKVIICPQCSHEFSL